ncbi:MAG TPA: type II toxin-antitoxin system VapC family toxin [Xanthobacteraceae bacterium]|nr:type II toxin-antitoxin system VapC family toxin [Xanthobacteraceae bacterium]
MLLLDTRIVIWAALDAPKLPAAARQLIAKAGAVYVSSVSLWEIGMKVSVNKLELSMSELESRLFAPHAVPLALTWSHAIRTHDIAGYHRDPFDRLLVAQAVSEPLHLLTTDKALGATAVWWSSCKSRS